MPLAVKRSEPAPLLPRAKSQGLLQRMRKALLRQLGETIKVKLLAACSAEA